MLRILHTNNSLPYSWLVDPNSEFEPGMIAQLKVYGNQIVCGVSDGLSPIGIIDDMKKTSFSSAKVDEVCIIPCPVPTLSGSTYVTPIDLKYELENPNIYPNSFVCNPELVVLNARNGVITVPAGTPLNYSSTNSGIFDSIRVIVRYSYQVPGIPGENSTEGTGRVTVWTSKIIAATDQFDTSASYALNSILFCGIDGKLSTSRIDETYPPVGIVTAPPTAIYSFLEFKTYF